jgi:hypothetical protein
MWAHFKNWSRYQYEATCHSLHRKTRRIVVSIGTHAFDGEGDDFPRKRYRDRLFTEAPLSQINHEGPIQMCEGDAFRGNLLARITGLAHQDGALLVRGYYWGCGMKGAKSFPMKPHPRTLTFINTIIISTPPFVLQEGIISHIAGDSIGS